MRALSEEQPSLEGSKAFQSIPTFGQLLCAKLKVAETRFGRVILTRCAYPHALPFLWLALWVSTPGSEVLRTFITRIAAATTPSDLDQEFDIYMSNLRFRQPRILRSLRLRISGTRLQRLRALIYGESGKRTSG